MVAILAVVGATASGKTSLSLDLAELLGGEVVNTDAMQVYRGMDIGTAKLPPHERRGIPHHLLDLLDVREPATVAEFQAMARAVVEDCRARGVTPVLVGGSALYTRAVLDRFEFPGTDPALRARLEGELAEVGSGALHDRLRRLVDRDDQEGDEAEAYRRVRQKLLEAEEAALQELDISGETLRELRHDLDLEASRLDR